MIRATLAMAALIAFVAVPGCQQDSSAPAPAESPEAHSDAEHGEGHADEHAHPTEGPHHGSLVELGDEEYHAEVVHDEQAGTVTIYILDGTAKNTVSIDAPQLTINVKAGDQPRQFALPAEPDAADPEGKSSRFVSKEADLGSALDTEGADARLVVKIAGKSYSGSLKHDHDHAHE